MTHLKKLINTITYYNFLIDLHVLHFFSKRYRYLIFIFTFFFGTFGYDSHLTDIQYRVKIVCFLFSGYIISTSILIFIVFSIPLSKEFLYNLLGKEFVVSKIGNPGRKQLIMFGGFAATAITANELGRSFDYYSKVSSANSALNAQLDKIRSDPNLIVDEKASLTIKALETHNQMVLAPAHGTLDRLATARTHQEVAKGGFSVMEKLASWSPWSKK